MPDLQIVKIDECGFATGEQSAKVTVQDPQNGMTSGWVRCTAISDSNLRTAVWAMLCAIKATGTQTGRLVFGSYSAGGGGTFDSVTSAYFDPYPSRTRHPLSLTTTPTPPNWLDKLAPNRTAYQPGKVWGHFLHFAVGTWGDSDFLNALCNAENGAGLSLPAFYEYDYTTRGQGSHFAGIIGFCCPESHEFSIVGITLVPDGNSTSGWGTDITRNGGGGIPEHHSGWVRITYHTTLGDAYLHFAVGGTSDIPKLVVGWEKGVGDADEVGGQVGRW